MDSIAVTTLVLIPVLLGYWTSAQNFGENCGSVGNGNQTDIVNASRAHMFYLNVDHPASCTGNITGWRVCYFGPETIPPTSSYWATYAVYRRTEDGSDFYYQRVSSIFAAVTAVPIFTGSFIDETVEPGGFNCFTDTTTIGDSPFVIQEGDVIGACVFDPIDQFFLGVTINRLQLDVVGEVSDESDVLMGRDTTGCTVDDTPAVIVPNQLSPITSRRLFISAVIIDTSNMATETSTSQDSTTTGSANENVSTTDVADSADGPTAPISTTVGVLIGVMLAIVVFSVCSLYIVCIYIVCVRQKIGQKELQAVQHSMTAVGIEVRGDPLNEQNLQDQNVHRYHEYESINEVTRELVNEQGCTRINRQGVNTGSQPGVFSDSLEENQAYVRRANVYEDSTCSRTNATVLRPRVHNDSLVDNSAYVHHQDYKAYEDNYIIRLDVNPAYGSNPGDEQGQ